MARERFQRAMLLHKAISMLRWAGKPEDIADKVRQLERRLSAEDQFSALCIWMGRCSLRVDMGNPRTIAH
jgi:ATP/maltotriose-dependent transcriptional regulator MalT